MRALAQTTTPTNDTNSPTAKVASPPKVRTKLTINRPGDFYEREADRVAERVMRMPKPLQRCSCVDGCPRCRHGEISRRTTLAAGDVVGNRNALSALRQRESTLEAVAGGQPLTRQQKAYFEPRFGVDFGNVRIHTDRSADAAARAVEANAYVRDGDIVFREGQYRPHTHAGRLLLAHELSHVVQQGAAPLLRSRAADKNGGQQTSIGVSDPGKVAGLVQRVMCEPPQPFMPPPGDCGWAEYLILRGSVETAKAVVSTLGACSPGDSCLFLAAKIAAVTAEIAARTAVMATCFKGGDSGHCEQLQNKINMMNRCYRHFTASSCSPELIAAMAVVVEKAREVIATATVAAAIAAVVALIIALIVLWEVIAALAAAAAEALAIEEAAAAVIALLNMLLRALAPA